MKKKILSLILILMLLPIASLFTACGNDDGYNLNNLQTDFNKIAMENSNIIISDGNLEFDYSNYADAMSVINSTEPYTSLSSCNFVFSNMIGFVCSYIDECSNNDVTNNATVKNNVKSELDEFASAIRDVNECFNLFAEALYDNQINPRAKDCVDRYENLVHSYKTLYASAGSFSNTLADLYYNHVLNMGNPNVYGDGIENFEAGVVLTKFESRIKYQLSNLSQSYVEMYVGKDLAKKVANSEETFDLTKFNYKSNVEALNKPINSVHVAIEKANLNKINFYDLAVQAQNLQTVLNNDCNKFNIACDVIDYTIVKNNVTATAYEKMCVNIIEANYNLVSEYQNILIEMLAIVTNS